MLSLVMLIGVSFSGNAEQNKTSTAVDAAAACEDWVTVYPVDCPEQYFHLCLDNYESLEGLVKESERQKDMRC